MMKRILVINGSASEQSSNQQLITEIARLTKGLFELEVFKGLKQLPHFDPELSVHNTPEAIVALRQRIDQTEGLIICTPEYVFSIPSGLKNMIEWCIATTVLSDKPTGLITASANGAKGHEELQLIMKTAMSRFTMETTLLIPGIKGKINAEGRISDAVTLEALKRFIHAFSQIAGAKEQP